ncbi:hypothetical protein OUZ56_015846 [Daphnia magna]|uniref:Uncharacterized protein n=1 Tax=Daphnia magna TaxID=35525 RepID=A0ABR0ANW6_9CRUS|nr:hypothetical protein OUZ56_015846 [Daphnia magna]
MTAQASQKKESMLYVDRSRWSNFCKKQMGERSVVDARQTDHPLKTFSFKDMREKCRKITSSQSKYDPSSFRPKENCSSIVSEEI